MSGKGLGKGGKGDKVEPCMVLEDKGTTLYGFGGCMVLEDKVQKQS